MDSVINNCDYRRVEYEADVAYSTEYGPKLTPEAELLVWAMTSVGINEICKESLDEALIRFSVFARLRQNRHDDVTANIGVSLSRNVVSKFIGLKIAIPGYTNAEFDRMMIAHLRVDAYKAILR